MRTVISTVIVEFPAAAHSLEVEIEQRDSITLRGKIPALDGSYMNRRSLNT
jgi:hypothetical protein